MLFWGILGVIVFRAILIGLGAALVMSFHWILFLFGAFLVFTGLKMFKTSSDKPSLEDNWMLRLIKKKLPRHGQAPRREVHDPADRSQDRQDGAVSSRPLFVSLIIVEFVDLIFAVDSVPAIFAVTQDPFIVYTSNIFAISGLRALYFALAAAMHRFKYLQYSLAVILCWSASRSSWCHWGSRSTPPSRSPSPSAVLASGILWSLWKTAMTCPSLPRWPSSPSKPLCGKNGWRYQGPVQRRVPFS